MSLSDSPMCERGSATDRKSDLTLPSGPLLRRPVVVASWLAEGAIGSAFLSSDSAVEPKSFSPSAYFFPEVFVKGKCLARGVNATRWRKELTLDAELAASSAWRLTPCSAPITVFITPYKNVQYT